jgi:hypothetical protein
VAAAQEGIILSTLYLLALCGVGLALLAVAVEAIVSVTRKRPWPTAPSRLVLVETLDRRRQALPFVGEDRRAGDPADATAPDRLRA